MSTRLRSLGSNPTLTQYMQGAAKQAITPFQEFIAPTVPVATMTGQFKKWDEKTPLVIPTTRRALGDKAAVIKFGTTDQNFNLNANSLDCPVDKLEGDDATIMPIIQEAGDITAQVASLASHKETVDLALTTLGSGTDKNVNASGIDLVDEIDKLIKAVILGAKGFAPMMTLRILWGFDGWRMFKNHDSVKNRFSKSSKKDSTNITLPDVSSLFVVPVESMMSTVVVDGNTGKDAASVDFLLGASLIIFATCAAPTRYDTSFMKTLRKRGEFLAPRFYDRDDGRVEVVGFDWNEQIIAANSSAGARLNWTNS